MHCYSKFILLLCITLATPLYPTRWQHAYTCDLHLMSPRCCIYTWKIIRWMETEICIVEYKSQGEPHRFSLLIDDFPACTVYRSGPCIRDAEICVPLRQHVYICQTSISLIFKHQTVEWCFSSYLKIFGVKMYKYSRLCTYFAEHYFFMPRNIEDLLIRLGY
ncbi:uncharacterized protein LOC129247399 [Anastrepha obliqua]|uniref:uncharacterized protein LOC129247399 n=1 Tax=Anastrepha obliqua TaxID=95512 RepID=UPI002409ECB2|nr:uncharacterized protein LOC129247399 [Anastrepha obliqua]